MKDLINLYPPIQVEGREQIVSSVQRIYVYNGIVECLEVWQWLRRCYPSVAPVRDSGPQQDSHGSPDEIWKSLIAGVHQIDIINKETFKRNKFGDSEH